MTARATLVEDEGQECKLVIDAEYSVGSDGTLDGVITGVDADAAEAAAELQPMAGQPFAARGRAEGPVMLVREVKFLGAGGPGRDATEGAVVGALAVAGKYDRR